MNVYCKMMNEATSGGGRINILLRFKVQRFMDRSDPSVLGFSRCFT